MNITSTLLPNIQSDLGSPSPQQFKDIKPLHLKQAWSQTQPKEKGHAYIGHCKEGLKIYTWFEEHTPFTTATENNQKLFLLGSVAEFFIHPQGTSAYWEIHLSPNGHIMDINISNRDDMMAELIPWEELVCHNTNASYQVAATDSDWATEITIPWAAFQREGIPVGEEWGMTICRYNYPDCLENPEYSATAEFTELGYHRLEEYNRVTFA